MRLVVLTIMRCVAGVASMLAVREIVLTVEAMQVRDGTIARGDRADRVA